MNPSYKNYIFFGLAILGSLYTVNAQTNDTIQNLDKVIIQSFNRTTPYLTSTTSAAKIDASYLKINNPERILEAVNIIPGTKMEERSPGSYRISLRGSTLRSPFGVRNVKIYFDDFILTDASGNSYLNIIDPNFINSIDIMKGPQGGEIGSETGGVIILNSARKDDLSLDLSGGSNNLFSEKFNFSKKIGNHFLQIAQAHHQTDSYREQSAVRRDAFFIKDRWNYANDNTLNINLMYTDLHYETPGGLNKAQMDENRRQARLGTATLLSAVDQKAGIYNKTFLGGLSHLWNINENWSQFTLIQTSLTDFKNPFISNYEVRDEKNFQGRLYLNYKKNLENIKLQTRVGMEAGHNSTDIHNYDNNRGVKGNPQKFDDLKTNSAFYYVTQYISIANKLFFDASLSLNTMKFDWEAIYPTSEKGKITFKNQWLPNFGVNYKIDTTFSIRAKIAKGASFPTTEEVRSSNQNIAQDLAAEYGWNKEIGARKRVGSLFFEVTLFDYNLKDAIVRRQDMNGNDYFINSGGTKQLGFEFLIESNKYQFNNNFLKGAKFLFSGTYYDFKYDNYQIATDDFSKNRVPGTANWSLQSLITLDICKLFSIDYTNYYTSNQYLNDANTIKEDGFIVGNVKLNTNLPINKHFLNVYLGVNNLYNTKYSAGYDLNAFGNRYYNPAALTNFYLGSKFSF